MCGIIIHQLARILPSAVISGGTVTVEERESIETDINKMLGTRTQLSPKVGVVERKHA